MADDKGVIRHPETTRPVAAADEQATETALALAAELTIPILLQRNAEQFGSLPALSMLAHPQVTLSWGELRRSRTPTAGWPPGTSAPSIRTAT